MPHYYIYNEEGSVVFTSLNHDPNWYEKPYSTGQYASTMWIPGNYLASGALLVSAAVITRSPNTVQFHEPQIIGFSVRDNMGPGTARGDWGSDMPGAVRPLLRWTTEYFSETEKRRDFGRQQS
jgi:lipopolysaccharide transport system ATP-binding protein